MAKTKIDLQLHELEKLAIFLHKQNGIVLDTQKLHRFKRKIEDVFEKHNIDNFNTFYHRIRYMNDDALLEDLTNAITVNETYFWREHEQFEILTKEVLPTFVRDATLNKVRILIAPSSSGEELYSIMLAILDAGKLIDKLNIEIVGIDIDSKMILKARNGLYTQRSVEKLPEHLLRTYFHKNATLYTIDKTLREHAKFLHVNIFDEKITQKLGVFDILFSRNMLIYFNEKDKQKCFHTFYDLLTPNGYLFLGHADANSIDKKYFSPITKGLHIYKKNSTST